MDALKKFSMYLPIIGIISVAMYEDTYIKESRVHFWGTAFVQALYTAASLIIIFN